MTNKYLEKIAKGEIIDMGMDSAGKLSKVNSVGFHPPALQGSVLKDATNITPKTGLASKILGRVGGFIKKNPLLSAGTALAGGALLAHRASQPSQPPQPQY